MQNKQEKHMLILIICQSASA